MSMGPKNEAEKVELSRFNRVSYITKKVVISYFKEPLYFLFYGTLTGVIISLLVGHRLPFELYIILAGLAVVQAKPYFNKPIKTKK